MDSDSVAPGSRRRFIGGMGSAAGVAIIGFDPLNRSCVTAAHAQERENLRPFPRFDGELVEDRTTLDGVAQDFGRIKRAVPRAVLRPRSVADVANVVRFAADNGLQVAMRGQGHGQDGAGLVESGIVIDSSTLNAVQLKGELLVAGAGANWGRVFDTALAAGLTPAVMVDAMDLSVGGVLAGSGGFGMQSPRHGLNSDHVVELEVVTGTGTVELCSRSRNPELFDMALVGLGQCALIVTATLRLVRAPVTVRMFTLTYPDLATCTADAARLVREDRFDALGVNIAGAQGRFVYSLSAGIYLGAPASTDEAALLAGLRFATRTSSDLPYAGWIRRLDGAISLLKNSPVWSLPHPWFAMMLPASSFDRFMTRLLQTPGEMFGQSPVLPLGAVPLATARFTNPLLRAPAEDVAFSVVLLRTVSTEAASEALAINRTLYKRARDLGGKRVVWGALAFTPEDWADHYGAETWNRLQRAKRIYDPRQVLTPGAGLFVKGR